MPAESASQHAVGSRRTTYPTVHPHQPLDHPHITPVQGHPTLYQLLGASFGRSRGEAAGQDLGGQRLGGATEIVERDAADASEGVAEHEAQAIDGVGEEVEDVRDEGFPYKMPCGSLTGDLPPTTPEQKIVCSPPPPPPASPARHFGAPPAGRRE